MSFKRAISLRCITPSPNGAIAVSLVICLWGQLPTRQTRSVSVCRSTAVSAYTCVRQLCQGLLRCSQERAPRDTNAYKNLVFVCCSIINLQTTCIALTSCSSCAPDHWCYYYKTRFGEDNIINNNKRVNDWCAWSPSFSQLWFIHSYSFIHLFQKSLLNVGCWR